MEKIGLKRITTKCLLCSRFRGKGSFAEDITPDAFIVPLRWGTGSKEFEDELIALFIKYGLCSSDQQIREY